MTSKKSNIIVGSVLAVMAIVWGAYSIAYPRIKKETIEIGDNFVVYGMLHNHSTLSDGLAEPEKLYDYARDVLKLDFYGLADHGFMLNDTEWKRLQRITQQESPSDDFFMFHGFEWSSDRYGHVSIFFSENYTDYRNPTTDTFTEILQWIEKEEAIAFLNHPGRRKGVEREFEHFSTEYSSSIAGIELWNKAKKIPAYYYHPGYYDNDDFGFYDEALQRGWHLGAAGSGDNHLPAWLQRHKKTSRLGVLVKKKTKQELEKALREKRFFTSDDRNVSMSLKVNGFQMGSTIEEGSYAINIVVNDEDREGFRLIELIKNGEPFEKWEDTHSLNASIDVHTKPEDYFYLRIIQDDGDMAISSPLVVE